MFRMLTVTSGNYVGLYVSVLHLLLLPFWPKYSVKLSVVKRFYYIQVMALWRWHRADIPTQQYRCRCFFRNFTHQATRCDDPKDDHFNAFPSPRDLNTFNPYRYGSSFTTIRPAGKLTRDFNPLNPELNPICYLLALLGAHHFLHVSRIRIKLLTFRRLMSYIYGAPILDVSRSHTTTQHSR